MSHQLTAYTMLLLRCGEHYLMLKRAETKRFAPGRWTGIGGRIEPHELDDLESAALRELHEETGISPREVHNLALRRVLVQVRPGHPVTNLLYFTGELTEAVTPESPEGTLQWLTEAEIAAADVIENTAWVIPLLIRDMERHPRGPEQPVTGAASFDSDGSLRDIRWT